jgi:hypothetical protein
VTEISADLVVGVLAAMRGDVILLPAGNVVDVHHDGQDTRTEGAGKRLIRMVQSADFLLARTETDVIRFAREWAAFNLYIATKNAIKGIYCRQISMRKACSLLLRYTELSVLAYADPQSRSLMRAARRDRKAFVGKPNIDDFLMQIHKNYR